MPLGMSSVFGGAKATQEADNVVIIQHGEQEDGACAEEAPDP